MQHTGRQGGGAPLDRAAELDTLLDAVKALLVPFVSAADQAAAARATGHGADAEGSPRRTVLVDAKSPEQLVDALQLSLPDDGQGKEGLLRAMRDVLAHSVNTWDQGFLDKLYASTNAVGVVSELLLAVLNTNLHVYQVSPALTLIEKHTARALAAQFGFTGPRAGGVTCPGGSASNLTSLLVARNTLYPATKRAGNGAHDFVLFTSAHGHYSVEKAAVTLGLGAAAVVAVPVDPTGRMQPAALRRLVERAKAAGCTPLYVNATAGSTVLGSYDPFDAIADVCDEHGLWMHVDASWGGPAAFSSRHRPRLAGVQRARSLTVNPHKMLNVPVTCSFLLGPDTAVLRRANTVQAGYLFHGAGADADDECCWDLADLTMQCGRRGDSLKLALSWIYYGAAGFARQIDGAFDTAAYLAGQIAARDAFVLVSSNPPPCLQVCFYYAGPGGVLAAQPEDNTTRTRAMVARLLPRGFMVDYAPGERGSFFRVVVNCQTLRGTMDGLVRALEEVGREVD